MDSNNISVSMQMLTGNSPRITISTLIIQWALCARASTRCLALHGTRRCLLPHRHFFQDQIFIILGCRRYIRFAFPRIYGMTYSVIVDHVVVQHHPQLAHSPGVVQLVHVRVWKWWAEERRQGGKILHKLFDVSYVIILLPTIQIEIFYLIWCNNIHILWLLLKKSVELSVW